MSLACHSYVVAFNSMQLVCTRISPYVTHMYLDVTRMSLGCIHMLPVCHSYVLVCHSYVTRLANDFIILLRINELILFYADLYFPFIEKIALVSITLF